MWSKTALAGGLSLHLPAEVSPANVFMGIAKELSIISGNRMIEASIAQRIIILFRFSNRCYYRRV